MDLPDDWLENLKGVPIKAASSSLNSFAVEFADGNALLAQAEGDEPGVCLSLVKSSTLPQLSEAVCAVDWSWIVGSTIARGTLSSVRLSLVLDPVGPLSISAGSWQGSPFLSFMPYRAPRAT